MDMPSWMGKPSDKLRLAGGFTEERSGLQIQMWHYWVIDVIKATSVAAHSDKRNEARPGF